MTESGEKPSTAETPDSHTPETASTPSTPNPGSTGTNKAETQNTPVPSSKRKNKNSKDKKSATTWSTSTTGSKKAPPYSNRKKKSDDNKIRKRGTKRRAKSEKLLLQSNIHADDDTGSWSDESYESTELSVEYAASDEERENEHQIAKLRRLGYRKNYWNNKLDFYLIVISYIVSPEAIITFSFFLRNYGVWCLGPLAICFLFIGFPLVYMELSLGQYTSGNVFTVFERMAPMMGGIGYVVFANNLVAVIGDIPFLAVSVDAVINSVIRLKSELPSVSCFNNWNNSSCRRLDLACSDLQNDVSNDYIQFQSRCFQTRPDFENAEAYYSSIEISFRSRTPAFQYATWNLPAVGDDSFEEKRWPSIALMMIMVICFLLIFLVTSVRIRTVLALCVSYMVAPMVNNIAVVLFSFEEVKFHPIGGLETNWRKSFASQSFWISAVTHTFYVLNIGQGTLITLGSMNKFRNNVFADAVVISLVALLVPLLSSLSIYCMFNEMVYYEMGEDMERLEKERPKWFEQQYSFSVYALDLMQAFFLYDKHGYWMGLLVVYSSVIGCLTNKVIRMESLVCSLTDRFTTFALAGRPLTQRVVLLLVCLISLLYVGECSEFLQVYLVRMVLPITIGVCVLAETITVFYLYGLRRFFCNTNLMIFGVQKIHIVERWRNKMRNYYNFVNMATGLLLSTLVPFVTIIFLGFCMELYVRELTKQKTIRVLSVYVIFILFFIPIYASIQVLLAYKNEKLLSNEWSPVPDLWGPSEEVDRKKAEYEERQLRI